MFRYSGDTRSIREYSLSPEQAIRLFNDSKDAVFILSLEQGKQGEIVANNSMAEAMHFYAPGELIGKNIRELDDPKTARQAPERIKRMLAGEVVSFTGNHIKKDGSIFPVSVTASLIRFNQKDYVLAFDRDVSSSRIALETLSFEQLKLQRILNGIQEGVLGLDASGSITFLNKRAADIFNMKQDTALYLDATEILRHMGVLDHLNALEFVQNFLSASHSSLEQQFGYSVTMGTKRKSFEVSISAISGSKISEGIVVLLFKDKTEEHFLEEQLRQTQKMQALGQLVGGIAHDFNNVLGAIINSSSLLRLPEISVDQRLKSSELILSSANNASKLIERLLKFSNEQNIQNSNVNLKFIVSNSLEIFAQLKENPIELEVNLGDENTDYTIVGDVQEIESSLLNIFINASHAVMRVEQAKIKIDLGLTQLDGNRVSDLLIPVPPGEYFRVDISDNGIGIKANYIDQIFEPYFSTKSSHKGVGLGLAMVFGTMKRHMGSVAVSSEPGKGACFSLFFPKAQLQKGQLDEESQQALFDLRGNVHKQLLMLGGMEAGFEPLSEALIEWGCQIHINNSIKKAVDYYKDYWRTIDFVIIDSAVIDGTAFQAMSLFRGINPLAKIIVQGKHFSKEEIAVYQAKGVVALLKRPYPVLNLISEMLSQDV